MPHTNEEKTLFAAGIITVALEEESREVRENRTEKMAQRGVARGRVAMDLKLSILSALNKLADRDTQQIAMDELVKIVESLQPDGISVFLGCLYEISPDQKSVVRREGVKLVSALASLYGDLLTPHLQKIISALIRRLKEPDSNIRDACVDAIGTLVAHVQAPASLANPAAAVAAAAGAGGGNADHVALSGPVGVFTKPLFDTLNEQTRSVQIGAAMCLARALDNAPELPPACTQRLCLRILKFLNSPSFNAKPALLPALGGLSRASGGAMNQHLGIVITCLQESLQSSDWATRKAAADTFGAVALSVGGAPLISFKSSTMALLDSYRFDKVKPARESVIDAIHIWKNVPDPPVVDASPTRTVSTKSNDSTGTLKTASSRKYLTADSRSCSPTVSSSVASHAIADKGSVKKKSASQAAAAAAAAERKTNLDFFRKLSIRNSDDWQIEVAVPRGSPPASHNKENHEETQVVQPVEKAVVVSKSNSSSNNNSSHGGGGEVHEEKEKFAFKALVDKFEAVEVKVAKEEISNGRSLNNLAATNGSNSFAANGWSHHHHQQQQQQQQHQHQHQQAAENGEVTEQQRKASAGGDLVSIGRQLSQLEKGQSELMEMLQEFMGNSQENTQTLESRVERLERALEEMARRTAAAIGLEDMARITAAASVGNARPPPSSYFSGNEASESSRASKEQQQHQHHQQQQFNSRNFSRHCEAETWNDNVFRGNRGGNEGLLVEQSSSSKQQQLQQKTWENQRSLVSGFVGRLGEGPSARSVWRASKDEATLAAIRVAGAGDSAAEADKLLLPSSARSVEVSGSSKNSLDQIQGTNNANSGGGGGGGGAWNVWGRAMESLQSGDLDCAYEEVICGGDELLLVRLMNRTGPVLEQLSSETVGEMLRSICQFLQQPSFVDAALPWIRQVTEMVRTNGPKCLGVSGEVKKELLASLQEASMLEFPERWMGNAVGKMANQLGNSWVDLQA